MKELIKVIAFDADDTPETNIKNQNLFIYNNLKGFRVE